jgi:hypothetical protein
MSGLRFCAYQYQQVTGETIPAIRMLADES